MRKMWIKIFGTAALTFMLCLSGLIISDTAFADQCVDNGNGTLTDNRTGLMWQKATTDKMIWDAAMSHASGLSLGGHSDWRLPDHQELVMFSISQCKDLLDVQSGCFWSSTTRNDSAMCVSLDDIFVGYFSKYNLLNVRAVRTAQ